MTMKAAVLHDPLTVDVQIRPIIALRHELVEAVDVGSDVAAPAHDELLAPIEAIDLGEEGLLVAVADLVGMILVRNGRQPGVSSQHSSLDFYTREWRYAVILYVLLFF